MKQYYAVQTRPRQKVVAREHLSRQGIDLTLPMKWLLARGIRPIIAHPERNKQVMKDAARLLRDTLAETETAANQFCSEGAMAV